MEAIERIQYQAALILTGTWKGSSRNKLYDELGWESMSDRRWCRRLIQIFKIRNRLTPNYLYEKLPTNRPLLCGGVNINAYVNIYARTTKYQNSFFPDAIKAWNNLANIGQVFHSCTSLPAFKDKILSLIRFSPKSIVRIHNRRGLNHIFQLRVGLSALRTHKRRHNFRDTPSDWCACMSSPESISHFLFECQLFHLQRAQLFNEVHQVINKYNLCELTRNIDLYLYGHRSITNSDNKKIILATIKFIEVTGRLDNS